MFENQVEPLLDDRRYRIPVERMLKNDDVMAFAKLLLMRDINKKVRIAGIQIMEGNAVQCFHGLPQGGIDGGSPECRMTE